MQSFGGGRQRNILFLWAINNQSHNYEKELEKQQNTSTLLTIYNFIVFFIQGHINFWLFSFQKVRRKLPLEDVVNPYFINNYYYTIFISTTPNTVTAWASYSCHPPQQYTIKKDLPFSRPQPGCHWPNFLWTGIIQLFPPRESLVSDIPARNGKIVNLFLQCTHHTTAHSLPVRCWAEDWRRGHSTPESDPLYGEMGIWGGGGGGAPICQPAYVLYLYWRPACTVYFLIKSGFRVDSLHI